MIIDVKTVGLQFKESEFWNTTNTWNVKLIPVRVLVRSLCSSVVLFTCDFL